MTRGIYTSLSCFRGFGTYAENALRFGRQYVGGMTARSLLGDLTPSIGTRSATSGIGLWHFVPETDAIAAHLAESHDAMRRAMTFGEAAAMTLDHESADEYGDIANRYYNRSEMSYGSAMELRYNVQ